jgi:hypothetical protein
VTYPFRVRVAEQEPRAFLHRDNLTCVKQGNIMCLSVRTAGNYAFHHARPLTIT